MFLVINILFVNSEFIDSLLLVLLMRAEDDAGEIRMVGTVGEVLGLEADG